MFAEIDTRIPHEVEKQIYRIHHEMFPAGDRVFVMRAFDWASACFNGRYDDYQPIDARYHDFEHTLQGTLCLARLLNGRHKAGIEPRVDQHQFELAILAILFHDTGYLKRRDDAEGTGAKFTVIHVARSADFARELLSKQGYSETDQRSVANMISCTGVNADLLSIPFQSETERVLGFALATADILGQMAAPDYVDKLPILFAEFVEAARWGGDRAARFARYKTPEELARRTPRFWQDYVQPKINNDFRGLYQFLNEPYPDGPNPYVESIVQNLARIERTYGAPPQAG
ncbi:MAG: hypothetical protein QOF48_3548 [Verrucomicrobiota bacterium]|jgi:hypothetical protein